MNVRNLARERVDLNSSFADGTRNLDALYRFAINQTIALDTLAREIPRSSDAWELALTHVLDSDIERIAYEIDIDPKDMDSILEKLGLKLERV